MSRFKPHINLYDLRPAQRITLHMLFWLSFFVVRLYLTAITFNVYNGFPTGVILLLTLNSTLLIAGFFYYAANVVWTFLKKKTYLVTFFLLLAGFGTYTVLDTLAERQALLICRECLVILKTSQPHYSKLLNSGFINIILTRLLTLGVPLTLLLTLTIPTCIKLALYAWRSQVRALQLAKDNLELEFNFLKSQLNPHFLFNSMNNIYGLILRGNKDQSAALVARLSALLRYMLYESNEQYMPLGKEITLLNDYIELETIRLNDTKVSFHHQLDSTDYHIAPLLFIPLVENAFKFCADDPEAYISVFLDIRNGRLRFTVDNSINHDRLATGGIGLVNFKKRLDLYYPGKYSYDATNCNEVYSVTLGIDL